MTCYSLRFKAPLPVASFDGGTVCSFTVCYDTPCVFWRVDEAI